MAVVEPPMIHHFRGGQAVPCLGDEEVWERWQENIEERRGGELLGPADVSSMAAKLSPFSLSLESLVCRELLQSKHRKRWLHFLLIHIAVIDGGGLTIWQNWSSSLWMASHAWKPKKFLMLGDISIPFSYLKSFLIIAGLYIFLNHYQPLSAIFGNIIIFSYIFLSLSAIVGNTWLATIPDDHWSIRSAASFHVTPSARPSESIGSSAGYRCFLALGRPGRKWRLDHQTHPVTSWCQVIMIWIIWLTTFAVLNPGGDCWLVVHVGS